MRSDETSVVTRILIRVNRELTDELCDAFPHLVTRRHPASTTVCGQVADQQELQGVLQLLAILDIEVVEVLTLPDD